MPPVRLSKKWSSSQAWNRCYKCDIFTNFSVNRLTVFRWLYNAKLHGGCCVCMWISKCKLGVCTQSSAWLQGRLGVCMQSSAWLQSTWGSMNGWMERPWGCMCGWSTLVRLVVIFKIILVNLVLIFHISSSSWYCFFMFSLSSWCCCFISFLCPPGVDFSYCPVLLLFISCRSVPVSMGVMCDVRCVMWDVWCEMCVCVWPTIWFLVGLC